MNALRKAFPKLLDRLDAGVRNYDHRLYLCWNVKMNEMYSFDRVWKRMCKEHFVNEAEAVTIVPRIDDLREAWDGTHGMNAYEYAIDDMRRSFADDDTYRTISPACAARWGIPYPEESWDVEYAFVGRSGGHLAIVKFEGRHLVWHDGEITDAIKDIPNGILLNLCCMMDEIHHAVKVRHEEMEYKLAFEMHQWVESDT
jgi:hypothetical protein